MKDDQGGIAMEKIFIQYKRMILIRIFVFLFIMIMILLLNYCTKDPLLDENEGLLLALSNQEEPLLTRICLDWAKSEFRCVREDQSKESLEEVFKETFFPELSKWERLLFSDSELKLCTKEEIEEQRTHIEPEELRRDNVALKKVYRCLSQCNEKFQKQIQCPREIFFDSLETYREYRDLGAGGFSLDYKNCELDCYEF